VKYIVIILVTVFVAIGAFQNCQNSQNPNSVNQPAASAQVNGEKIIQPDLGQAQINQVNLFFQEKQTVQRSSGSSYDLIANKTLKINLETSLIEAVTEFKDTSEKYCLSEDLKSELLSILRASQVCQVPPATQDQICTQVMALPYAQIITNQEQVNLGEATDGCGSNKVNLCGDQATVLQGYISHLKQVYSSLTCP
jgi:hypothetical protein